MGMGMAMKLDMDMGTDIMEMEMERDYRLVHILLKVLRNEKKNNSLPIFTCQAISYVILPYVTDYMNNLIHDSSNTR
jgi:hypothetical protein